MEDSSIKVSHRGDKFATRLNTKITNEVSATDNPYLVDTAYYFGYEHLDLLDKKSFSDVIFLLFRGQLPSEADAKLFNQILLAFINPGPRHPAVQAAIATGVGKTQTEHILPIALNIYSGNFDGPGEIGHYLKFFRKHINIEPDELSETYDLNDLPGFGTLYGDPDPYAEKLLLYFCKNHDRTMINWLKDLNLKRNEVGDGITKSGLCAGVLSELGFLPRQAASIMQIMAAPGLVTHGLEYCNKPLTSMFFENDDQYELQLD